MIAVLEPGCPMHQKAEVVRLIESEGLRVQVSELEHETLVGVVGQAGESLAARLEALPGVREVRMTAPPYPLTARAYHPADSRIRVAGVTFGGPEIVVAAGPCAVEDEKQLLATARCVAGAGARLLRGGAFKPRSSPYSFQGLGEQALRLLYRCSEVLDLPIVTEVMDTRDVGLVAEYADILQIGARNMQNFNLLTEVGKTRRPVLLKRGMSSTVKDLLMSAEYILSQGNRNVILCERGIRTFEEGTRNTVDISAVPAVQGVSHLPIIVDPSHGTGRRDLVAPMARAAVASGAHGIIVEVHSCPEKALCDGAQSLTPQAFREMMSDLRKVAKALGRIM